MFALVLSKKTRQSQTPDLSNRFIVIILFFGPSTSWSTSFYYHVFSVRLYVIWYLDDVVGEIGEKHVFEVCQGVLRRNKESGKLQILCGLLTRVENTKTWLTAIDCVGVG